MSCGIAEVERSASGRHGGERCPAVPQVPGTARLDLTRLDVDGALGERCGRLRRGRSAFIQIVLLHWARAAVTPERPSAPGRAQGWCPSRHRRDQANPRPGGLRPAMLSRRRTRCFLSSRRRVPRWVRWAVPSAPAIRQALLSRSSGCARRSKSAVTRTITRSADASLRAAPSGVADGTRTVTALARGRIGLRRRSSIDSHVRELDSSLSHERSQVPFQLAPEGSVDSRANKHPRRPEPSSRMRDAIGIGFFRSPGFRFGHAMSISDQGARGPALSATSGGPVCSRGASSRWGRDWKPPVDLGGRSQSGIS